MADRDCACGCSAARLARVCGLSLQPIGCTSALACDVQCYCSCSLWRYISVMPLLGIICRFYHLKNFIGPLSEFEEGKWKGEGREGKQKLMNLLSLIMVQIIKTTARVLTAKILFSLDAITSRRMMPKLHCALQILAATAGKDWG